MGLGPKVCVMYVYVCILVYVYIVSLQQRHTVSLQQGHIVSLQQRHIVSLQQRHIVSLQQEHIVCLLQTHDGFPRFANLTLLLQNESRSKISLRNSVKTNPIDLPHRLGSILNPKTDLFELFLHMFLLNHIESDYILLNPI